MGDKNREIAEYYKKRKRGERDDEMLDRIVGGGRRQRKAKAEEREAKREYQKKRTLLQNAYTVQPGDSWFSIAGSEMGDQRYAGELARANPGFDVLKPGTVIMLPPAGGEETPVLTYEDYEMLEGIQEKVEEAQAQAKEPPVTANSTVDGGPAGIEAEHDMIRAHLDRQEADEIPGDGGVNGLEEEFNVADYEAEAQAIAQMLLEMQALREQEEAETKGSLKVAALAQDVVLQEETQEQKEANELLDTWFQTQVADMKILGQDNYRAIHDEYQALQNGISQGNVTYSQMYRKVYGKEYVPTPIPTPTEGLPPPAVTIIAPDTATPELTEERILETPTPAATPEFSFEFIEQYSPVSGEGFRITVNSHGTEIPYKGLHPGYDVVSNDFTVRANVTGKVYFFQTLWEGGKIQTRAFDTEVGYPANDDSYEDFGNYAVLVSEINGQTYYQVFAHMEFFDPNIKQGDEVAPGTVLGNMGDTGAVATNDFHVHWEVRPKEGVFIDANNVIRLDTFERKLAEGDYPAYYPQDKEELGKYTINPYEFAVLINSLDNQ